MYSMCRVFTASGQLPVPLLLQLLQLHTLNDCMCYRINQGARYILSICTYTYLEILRAVLSLSEYLVLALIALPQFI